VGLVGQPEWQTTPPTSAFADPGKEHLSHAIRFQLDAGLQGCCPGRIINVSRDETCVGRHGGETDQDQRAAGRPSR